jgi:hypothetical protein
VNGAAARKQLPNDSFRSESCKSIQTLVNSVAIKNTISAFNQFASTLKKSSFINHAKQNSEAATVNNSNSNNDLALRAKEEHEQED